MIWKVLEKALRCSKLFCHLMKKIIWSNASIRMLIGITTEIKETIKWKWDWKSKKINTQMLLKYWIIPIFLNCKKGPKIWMILKEISSSKKTDLKFLKKNIFKLKGILENARTNLILQEDFSNIYNLIKILKMMLLAVLKRPFLKRIPNTTKDKNPWVKLSKISWRKKIS